MSKLRYVMIYVTTAVFFMATFTQSVSAVFLTEEDGDSKEVITVPVEEKNSETSEETVTNNIKKESIKQETSSTESSTTRSSTRSDNNNESVKKEIETVKPTKTNSQENNKESKETTEVMPIIKSSLSLINIATGSIFNIIKKSLTATVSTTKSTESSSSIESSSPIKQIKDQSKRIISIHKRVSFKDLSIGFKAKLSAAKEEVGIGTEFNGSAEYLRSINPLDSNIYAVFSPDKVNSIYGIPMGSNSPIIITNGDNPVDADNRVILFTGQADDVPNYNMDGIKLSWDNSNNVLQYEVLSKSWQSDGSWIMEWSSPQDANLLPSSSNRYVVSLPWGGTMIVEYDSTNSMFDIISMEGVNNKFTVSVINYDYAIEQNTRTLTRGKSLTSTVDSAYIGESGVVNVGVSSGNLSSYAYILPGKVSLEDGKYVINDVLGMSDFNSATVDEKYCDVPAGTMYIDKDFNIYVAHIRPFITNDICEMVWERVTYNETDANGKTAILPNAVVTVDSRSGDIKIVGDSYTVFYQGSSE